MIMALGSHTKTAHSSGVEGFLLRQTHHQKSPGNVLDMPGLQLARVRC
jgi:hypothetical protein